MNKDILVFDQKNRRGYSVKRLDRSTMLHFCMSSVEAMENCKSDTWICKTDKAEGMALSAYFYVEGDRVYYQWAWEANAKGQFKNGVVDTRAEAINEALDFLNKVDFDCDTLPHCELPGWTLALLDGSAAKYDYIDTIKFWNVDAYELARAGGELWIVNGDDESDEYNVCIGGISYRSIITCELKESLKLNQAIEEDEEETGYLAF